MWNCFASKKFFKSFGYPVLVFIIVIVIIFINSIYQPCIPSWSCLKWALWHLYHMNMWIFRNSMIFQYKATGLETNRISYKIFDLRHVKKNFWFTLSEEKQSVHMFIQVSKRRKWINIKQRGCRIVRKTLPNIITGLFLHQDSKINLKWMNTKMQEKTVHFFNVDLAQDTAT